MRSKTAKIWHRLLLISLLLGGVTCCLIKSVAPAAAAAGINQQINFQGRLLNAQGAVVADGYYNIEFKIYQDGDGQSVGDTTGSPAGSLKWTEDWLNTGGTQGVKIQNGFMSVQLGSRTAFGSSINWNSDTLWLSMQVGNTSNCTITTTFQSNCGGDGEMVPMKRLSANAYSLNSSLLNGLSSAQFLQLGQGLQTDAANVTSLYVNKTGTGNIVNLQSGGNDAFIINNSGDINFGANANHVISVNTAGSGVAGKSLTLSAGGAGSGGTALAGGDLVLQGGAGGGTNGNGGSITIDAGVKNGSGSDGTITIGATTATSITIGKSGTGTTVGGTLTVNSGLTLGTGAGVGSFTNNGSTVNTVLAVSNLASGGSIGSAASTVDVYTAFTINQTSSGQTITLPSPTSSAAGRIIYISNIGTTSFTLLGTTLNTGGTAALVWNGSAWTFAGSASDPILNQSASAQTANFYIRSAANNKVAAVIEGANGQTVDLIDINKYNGTTSSTVTSFDSNGYLHFSKPVAVSDAVVMARGGTDTNDRFTVGADGKLSWGPGNAGTDVTLSRSGSGQLSVAGGLTVGNVSSTTALQVQNNSGQRVLGVDTSTNQVLLGQANQLNGALVFKNSASSNTVTLNSTAATSSYTLTLPSQAPAGGLCLETSTGTASQLVFASCSNNNTSITEVQTWDANNTNILNINPSTIGDEIVLTTQIPTGGVSVSSISGGGVSTWSKVVANAGNGTVDRVEMWVGTVTSTGSSNITVTYSSSPGVEEVTATEFTAAGVNSSTSWGTESFASQLNSTSSTTVTYPSLTSVNGSELYIGYAQVQNPPSTAGSNSNFNYIVTSTQHNVLAYNTSLTANTTYQPTANQNTSGQSNTVAAVLTAFVTSTSINNTTSLQKANFYVQAASSGSVAGVLQAASTGTADVLNVRSSSGTNVLSVGYTGITTFKNSSDSSAAFQIQNTSGNNIFSVSTSGNQVILGTSSTLGGSLAFANATNSNTITLAAPSSVAASYTLNLPSNTPTAGLCLGTSPSNANQLIFASCATQVSAASISHVNKWSNSGSAVTTLSDSPTSLGNLLVFYSWANNNVSVSSVSGGGVTNWTKVTSDTSGGAKGNIEMWRGVVTTTGSGTITVTYSGGAGTNEIVAQEFSMGSSNGTWAVDTSGTLVSAPNTTTINYPSLTALNSSELYAGYAYGKGTMTAGSTSGFTYLATSASKYLAYNPSTSAGTSYQPTATQTNQPYASIAAIIGAYAGTSVIVNSTAVQQANFNVQAATSGTVAGTLQAASSGTADILQLKNGSGNVVASINGGSTGLTLGSSSSVSGVLTFAGSGNGNTITLSAPTTIGASYSLSLPASTPAPAQCLSTSASDATKLVFSSCANQVTSVAISYVNSWSANGNSITTLSTSPTNIGDLMILFSNPQGKGLITSVSGGGVSVWSKVISDDSGGGGNTSAVDMWRGVVTSTGSSTITVTFSPGPGNPNELAATEFTMGSATGSWVVDSSSTSVNSASTTNVDYPSLTPQGTKDLYVGYASAQNTMSAGSTSGYSWVSTSLGHYITYNTTVNTTTQPSANQSPAGKSITVGALIAAYSSSSVIANSTNNQQANMNIQAAVSNSVTAVFQAGAVGSADIIDILDSSGTIVDSFSSTGNLLVKPSTASSSAFQVQTTGSVNVFSVDTSNLRVKIGAGSAGEATPSLLVLDNETGTSNDPTVLNGAMYYNATTHTFRCGVDGTWQSCSGLMYANSSNSSANNNCSNNCGAFSTSASVPANYCQTGRVIRLIANGYFSSQSSPSQIQFGLYYGTDSSTAGNDTLLGSLSPAESVTSASNNFFQMNFNLICFSTSSMQVAGTLNLQTGTSAAGMTAVPMASTSATTVSSGSAKNLYVFPIWDTATTSNTATMTQLIVNSY
jgi:hypothetical protein